MQTMTNNTLSFGAIKADKSARSLLAKRLDTAKKYLRFEDLKAWQRNNPVDIFLSAENGRLVAKVQKDGTEFLSEKENRMLSAINFSPIGFVRKICAKAENLK